MPAPYKTTDTVDFVVIGSGAAGGSVAKELSEAGFDVVILEQGPYLKEKDFTHDEVKFGYRNSPLMNDFRRQPQTFRQLPSETARQQRSVGYGRQVGGGTVHFNANYWRFLELDFKERSIWGEIPGTGFADWPITYADLEPYYTQSRIRHRRLWSGRRQPHGGPSLEAISAAAHAGEIFGRPVRARREEAGITSIPSAGSHHFAKLQGPHRLPALRLLPSLRLRVRLKIQFPGHSNPNGGADQALRSA